MRFGLLLGLALVACSVPTHTQGPPAQLAQSTKPVEELAAKTVALVDSHLGAPPEAFCSGVWVGDEAILTAEHCVREVRVGDGLEYVVKEDLEDDVVQKTHWGTLIKKDDVHDLALVRAFFAPPHRVALLGKDPYVGQPVQTMGHPLGLWYSYSTGVVAAVRTGDPAVWVQSTAPISPGNSGGGLFDSSGNLLGVSHAYMPKGENLNFYIHVMHVRTFLSEYSSG